MFPDSIILKMSCKIMGSLSDFLHWASNIWDKKVFTVHLPTVFSLSFFILPFYIFFIKIIKSITGDRRIGIVESTLQLFTYIKII